MTAVGWRRGPITIEFNICTNNRVHVIQISTAGVYVGVAFSGMPVTRFPGADQHLLPS